MPDKPRVLVVDDNLEMARTLADSLCDQDFNAVAVGSGSGAADILKEESIDALVTDLRMPKVDGLDLLALSRSLAPERPVLIMTAYSAIDTAVESIRQGAYHYLTKPFKVEELVLFLRRALDDSSIRREAAALKRTLHEQSAKGRILGSSAAMHNVRELVTRVAPAPVPVLLLGETGTGKSLVVQEIHAQSPRASRSFVVVNCAALPETLLESELFGYIKGAFTGAASDRPGLFREADGGTLLLDEIGEMALGLQAKLLHVLERGRIRPVGSSKDKEVDVRIIAATHRNLHETAQAGKFRQDLLYRLDVLSLTMPPLRDRREDLPETIAYFLQQAREKYAQAIPERLSREAMDRLCAYSWPGNVRELRHVMEKIVLLGRSQVIAVEDLPATVLHPDRAPAPEFSGEILPIRELQRKYALWALAQLGGHKGKAAEKLEIDAKTLWKWLSNGSDSPDR
jgi:two-component system, NtrC family, response regulator HydG